MNNRRDFLRDLGLGLSAMVFAPKIIKPTFRDTLRFNRPEIWRLNPEYATAPYELGILAEPYQKISKGKVWIGMLFKRKGHYHPPDGSWAMEAIWDDLGSDLQSNLKSHDALGRIDGLTWFSDPIPVRLRLDKTYIPPYIEI